jgi:peptidase E
MRPYACNLHPQAAPHVRMMYVCAGNVFVLMQLCYDDDLKAAIIRQAKKIQPLRGWI